LAWRDVARRQDGSTFYVYLEVNEFDQDGQTLYGGKISRVLRHQHSSSAGDLRSHVDDDAADEASEPVYIGNYKVENTIAEGLYGKVKIAIHRLTGQKVAFPPCLAAVVACKSDACMRLQVVLKVIERSKIDRERFREIALMKQLRHRHVVRMLEVPPPPLSV
jgi:serine/threonine protein kinase